VAHFPILHTSTILYSILSLLLRTFSANTSSKRQDAWGLAETPRPLVDSSSITSSKDLLFSPDHSVVLPRHITTY
jgi:hypothetical protein